MTLEELRKEIDSIDHQLLALFAARMEVSARIAAFKREQGLAVRDGGRERQKLREIAEACPSGLEEEAKRLWSLLFELSRGHQQRLMEEAAAPQRCGEAAAPRPPCRCGLLGRRLGHSYSPEIHRRLGDYEYRLYEVEPEELADFLSDPTLAGLNVTIPYKKEVVPFCASLSETARRLGSVNTLVRRRDGRWHGDNTDAFGFAHMMKKSGIDPRGKKALVLGSGGAGVTVAAVLRELGASVTTISRSGPDHYGNLERHADAALLVNATPVGMYPQNGAAPLSLAGFPALIGVLDLIYNPARTALLLEAERRGIPHLDGLPMLVAQAARSSALFAGGAVEEQTIDAVERALRRSMENIVLVGMPGCGKSTIAALLAKRLGREAADADDLITERHGPIPALFAAEGEAGFRRRESEVLAELGRRSSLVIATGGGAVTREENYPLLHQNGRIVWLRRPLELLPTDGRPLSQAGELAKMYERRSPLYQRFADCAVDNDAAPEETVRRILEVLAL